MPLKLKITVVLLTVWLGTVPALTGLPRGGTRVHTTHSASVRPSCSALTSALVGDDAVHTHSGVQTLLGSAIMNTVPTEQVAESSNICIAAETQPTVRKAADFAPVSAGLHVKVIGKVLNLWGLLYGVSIVAAAVAFTPLMFALTLYADLIGDYKRRRVLDWMIHHWARLSLSIVSLGGILGTTRLLGAENLPEISETVVYVPNHTSFFDILLLSGYVPRPFKYLSKAEILNIPLVGLGMKLARHVFLKRNDLQSTVQCADTVNTRLQDGNSVVLFAEGTRSVDGTLKSFKKGAFQMAKAAGVRVVPVSIGNLHRLMPSSAALPLAPLRHTYIRIHPPIDTKDKTIKEIKNACFEAVNSGLLPYQQSNRIAEPTGSLE